MTFTNKVRILPAKITTGMPAPISPSHTRRYPDTAQWAAAREMEMQNMERERVIDWTSPALGKVEPIYYTVSYTYRWEWDGNFNSRKDICSLRGDLMSLGIHYDPRRTQCPTAHKRTDRLLFAVDATHQWPTEHIDITNAYVLEAVMYEKPIYVREREDSGGNYVHGKTRDGSSKTYEVARRQGMIMLRYYLPS